MNTIQKKWRILALFLVVTMLFGAFSPSAVAVLEQADSEPAQVERIPHDETVSEDHGHSQNVSMMPHHAAGSSILPEMVRVTRGGQEGGDLAFLRHRLAAPMGMQGFGSDWRADPDEIVEIAVQFITPPAVALRLLHEEERPHVRLSDHGFEAQALAAHDAFREQLQPLTRGRSATAEIFSEHHNLFNGVFMRVPQHMVERIAELPEVFSVIPNARVSIGLPPIPMEEVGSADFMREAMELFDVDTIHNTMGFTGQGVRVAVLDTGVDHTHPRLRPYQDPATGRIRGWNYMDDTSDMMDGHGHGTHVSGSVIALAPDVELWHFQVMDAGGFATIASVLNGIESAHRHVDVMNLSLGEWGIDHPFFPWSVAANLAMLDGTVVIAAAGNEGPAGYSLRSPGAACLVIAVASGTLGGRNDLGDTVSDWSSQGPVSRTHHIKPDITAPGEGIVSALPEGGYGAWSGTSMAAPHVAGIAALMLQARPDSAPYEIKARMMNTARPLADLESPTVFAVGAGFVDPIRALESAAFATVGHRIPWQEGDGYTWREETMASLSFGRVVGRYTSDPLTVTIHNPGSGTWAHEVQFNGYHAGAGLQLVSANTSGARHTYTFQINAEWLWTSAEGNLVFTNGSQRITLPFAVSFEEPRSSVWIDPHDPWEPSLDYDFFRTVVGYDTVRQHQFRITNDGNRPTGAIQIALSGPNPGAFVLDRTSIPSLGLFDEAFVTVAPRLGLGVGTYEATVTVFTPEGGDQSFAIRFQVDAYAVYEIDVGLNHLVPGFNQWIVPSEQYGYDGVWGTGVFVRNVGNVPTGPLTVSLIGADPNSFFVEHFETWEQPDTIPSIEPGDFDQFFSVWPQFDLAVGTYTATVVVSSERVPAQFFDISFTVTPTEPGGNFSFSIELDAERELEFGTAPVGYQSDRIIRVGVTNTGNQWIDDLEVRLSGANPGSFWWEGFWGDVWITGWSPPFGWTFPPDATVYFGIRVAPNLPAGLHTATVTLSNEDGIYESLDLRFIVESVAPGPILLDVALDRDLGTAVEGYDLAWREEWIGIPGSERWVYAFTDHATQAYVINTGAEMTENLTVAIEGPHANRFNLYYWRHDAPVGREVSFFLWPGGSGSFWVRPVFGLAPGTYEATIVVRHDNRIVDSFDVRFTVVPRMYSMELEPAANHNFGTGVSERTTTHWVHVRNTGNVPTGDITISLSGTNPDSFRVSRTSIPSLAAVGDDDWRWIGAEALFVVAPRPGLTPGTYTAMVTVSGEHIAPLSFTVRFGATPTEERHPAYMFGNDEGHFMPRENATRADVAAILARVKLLDFEQGTRELPAGMTAFNAFSDVNSDDWFYYYVAWAYDAGLVRGDGERFRPRDLITRQEFAAMLARTIDYATEAGTMRFGDAAAITSWAAHYVYTVYSMGWMVGDDEGNFNPLRNTARADVATAMNRILGRIDSRSAFNAVTVANLAYARPFPDVAETDWFFPSVLAAANDHRLTRNEDGVIDWKYIIR